MRFSSFICSFLVLVSSCKHRETPLPVLYPDYRAWGDEESGGVTVKMQYRLEGPEGSPIAIRPPGKVAFDGQEIPADSSKMNGAYYEVARAAKDFGGAHRIEFTAPDQRQFNEAFEFPFFSLKNDPGKMVGRGEDLVLELDGLRPTDYINVLVNDTSFYGRGIDRIDTVKDGRMIIGKDELNVLRDGPVRLELYREEERPLKGGGRLWMSYGLRREFELGDGR